MSEDEYEAQAIRIIGALLSAVFLHISNSPG